MTEVAELFAQAGVLHQAGRLTEAEAAYRQVLALKPDYLGAIVNLGAALMKQGKAAEAVEIYRQAIAIKPDYAEAYHNLGSALLAQGKLATAAESYENAVAHKPGYAEAHNNLGYAYRHLGDLPRAEEHYRRALAVKPDYVVAHHGLGTTLCLQHRLDEGFAAYRNAADASVGVAQAGALAHRLTHDREQFGYLVETGVANPNPAGPPPAIFDGPIRYAGGGGVDGSVLGQGVDPAEVAARWDAQTPNLAIIDDFLTADALKELQRFCLGSTIWRRTLESGSVAAYTETGFAAPIMARIADELRGRLPAIFGHYPLMKCWAVKHYDRLGADLRLDFAAVNVHFWITPDDANRDPGGGGLVVWDVRAPLFWDANRNNETEDVIRRHLAFARAQPLVVPYRANRAVIFDADLFYESDKIDFKDGYRNRRIDITMLYGSRSGI